MTLFYFRQLDSRDTDLSTVIKDGKGLEQTFVCSCLKNKKGELNEIIWMYWRIIIFCNHWIKNLWSCLRWVSLFQRSVMYNLQCCNILYVFVVLLQHFNYTASMRFKYKSYRTLMKAHFRIKNDIFGTLTTCGYFYSPFATRVFIALMKAFEV